MKVCPTGPRTIAIGIRRRVTRQPGLCTQHASMGPLLIIAEAISALFLVDFKFVVMRDVAVVIAWPKNAKRSTVIETVTISKFMLKAT